jgi:hypothetical protein
LSAVAAINQAVDVGDAERTFQALSHEDACIPSLDENNTHKYQKHLSSLKTAKRWKIFSSVIIHHFSYQYIDSCLEFKNTPNDQLSP